jgi:elongation factor 1 alpha-like protein
MALVEIELATGERPLCVDSFKQVKDMGRITVRRGGETIAAGIITQPLLSTE